MESINKDWRPSKKTSNALLAHGYSQQQLNNIGKAFLKRYWNKILPNASTEFTKMVRSSGPGHNVKPKLIDNSESLKKRKADINNKSKDGSAKAKKIKAAEVTDEMKLASANMIAKRYENTSFAEAKRLVGLDI